jgi:hypothetical protein
MKKNKLIISLTFCLLFLITGVQKSNAQLDPNTRDILLLTKWFEGEFDNDSQLWFEGRMEIKDVHERVHTIHTRIEAPEIGKHVFYIEEYTGGDTTNISRQRIVSFKSNAPKEEIEMELYFLKDSKKYLGGYKNLEIFKNFSKNNLFGLDGCNVFFTKVGEQYQGSMRDKACVFGEGNLKRYSVHNMTISKNQYWRVDRTFLMKDDSFHKGHPNSVPHKMRRADIYSCDVNFYMKSYAEPDEGDVAIKGLKIHDQGGFAWVTYPKDNKKYGFQLRDKEYPFYATGSDFFMMRFIEEGKKRSNILVTAEPDAKKLSFNSGWVSCFCQKIEE